MAKPAERILRKKHTLIRDSINLHGDHQGTVDRSAISCKQKHRYSDIFADTKVYYLYCLSSSAHWAVLCEEIQESRSPSARGELFEFGLFLFLSNRTFFIELELRNFRDAIF